MSGTELPSNETPRERVYDLSNGFRQEAEHMFKWLQHEGFSPGWDSGVREGEYRYGITLPQDEVPQLHTLQRQYPARWGNAPEVAQELRESQAKMMEQGERDRERRSALTPEQDNWIEILHQETGLNQTQALDLNEQLHELAAAHFVLCLINVNDGELSPGQERALEAIEQKVRDAVADVSGVTDAKFIHDPRGSTAGLVFSSGRCDSLSGCYKVPLNPGRVQALQHDEVSFWEAWADEPKNQP